MTTFKDFQHFFNQLWHSYHARYKIPYAQDDKENFARRLWDWITNQKGYEKYLPSEEEILEEIVQVMNNKILEGYTPVDLAKAISKRIGE